MNVVMMRKLNVYKPVPEHAVADYEAQGYKRVEGAPLVDSAEPPKRGRRAKRRPGAKGQ